MRIFIKIDGDHVHYRLKGVLTFAPLWATIDQWKAWGEALPDTPTP